MADGQAQKKTDFNQSQRNNPSRVGQVSREQKRQINTDWQYLQGQEAGNNASSDQIFNQNYQKQGLQPQNFNEYKEKKSPEAANEKSYYQSRETSRRNRRRTKDFRQSRSDKTSASRKPLNPLNKGSASKKLLKTAVRAKGTGTSGTILSLYLPAWGFLQLPAAVLGLIGLAAVSAAEDSFFASISFSIFGVREMVEILFPLTYFFILGIGIISFLVMYFIYIFTLTKPLSGEKASLKLAVLLLSMIGYFTPVANLLPWLLLWVLVIWLYPE